MLFPLVVVIAQLSAAPQPVQRAYQKLTPQELEAHKTKHKPPKDAQKLDVSSKIRSASFGHKTWLHVAKDNKEFWVEYGRSTNTPPAMFGPFKVEEENEKAGEKKAEEKKAEEKKAAESPAKESAPPPTTPK